MLGRKFLLYKVVATNKASVYYRKLPFLEERVIPDWPPLAIHGFFCVHGVEVIMPDKGTNAVIYASECYTPLSRDDTQEKGYISGDHRFNQLPKEFWDEFWIKPPSITINDAELLKDMNVLWPGLNKNPSEKTWEYQAVKHKYELPCTEEEYLEHAARHGKSCITTFLNELHKQDHYVFGSNQSTRVRTFNWVNGIFKHKVDCRFRQLHNDESYFGLEKIGVLGKLYPDNFEWEVVNLVVSEDNVEEEEKIDDESKFYLQNLNESVRMQMRNLKMDADKGKRKMGQDEKSVGKNRDINLDSLLFGN